MESPVLNEDSRQISAALVQGGFDYRALGPSVGIRLQFQHIGFEEYFFEEFVDIETLFGTDFLALVLAAPFFDEDVHVGKLLAYLVGMCSRLVYFVDGEYHRHTGRLRVADGFKRLGHYRIVRRHHDYDQVGDFGSAGTHGGERFVTGGVEERDVTSVGKGDIVGTDVLCDTSGFTGDDVRLSDVVQQGCLTVVHVTHNGNDGRSGGEVLFRVDLFFHILMLVGGGEFYLVSEFLGDQHEGFRIETLVYGDHQTQIHAGFDYLGDGGAVHHRGQFVDGDEFRHFENIALHLFEFLFLCQTFLILLPLVAFML